MCFEKEIRAERRSQRRDRPHVGRKNYKPKTIIRNSFSNEYFISSLKIVTKKIQLLLSDGDLILSLLKLISSLF